jgi:predicted nucleic acid-binding protein
MSVLDTSVVVDLLLGAGVADRVTALLELEGAAAAPELLVFEVVAVLRRHAARGAIDPERAHAGVADLGDVAIQLYPMLSLRGRAWDLRANLTAADALFVALAERLGEPLVTKDRGLASAARTHAGIEVVELAASS